MKLNCKICNKGIRKAKSQVKNGEGKYCSKKCYSIAQKGIDLFANKARGIRPKIRVEIDCAVCSKRFETIPSKIGIRKFCSKACFLTAHRAILENIKQLRDTQEYRIWRIMVYKRDNFKCQSCSKVGNNLEAHHIKPISLYPELIFSLENGITLCGGKEGCHKIVHKSYRPLSKSGEFLGNLLLENIRSQARVGTSLKVQRLATESRTDGNVATSAAHESDDIVRANRRLLEAENK